MMDCLVSVIIPAWGDNSPHALKQLLESIESNVTLSCEVIVVCNSGTPQLLDLVRSHQRVNKYCLNSINVGVSRAWNIGSHMAEGEIFCYLNQDVILGPRCLETLVNVIKASDRIGMVGVEGANIAISPKGKVITLERILAGSPRYCNAVSGFLFLLKREVYIAAGGFDDLLVPCSYEELDMSFRVQAAGYRCYVVPGLNYKHNWSISKRDLATKVKYLGHNETIRDINERNRRRFVQNWRGKVPLPFTESKEQVSGNYYDADYFARSNYKVIMTQPRQINNQWEQPLAITLADMVDASIFDHSISSILELGSAYGFVVKELVTRGYDAYGVDISEHCIKESAIPERVFLCDARTFSTERRYDLVLASNFYEHLTDADAKAVTNRISKISDVLFTIINKSRHDPTHVNIKPNWRWILFFRRFGFLYHSRMTASARAKYLEKSNGSERWHRDCLVFVRDSSKLAPSLSMWWLGLIKELALDIYDQSCCVALCVRNIIVGCLARIRR